LFKKTDNNHRKFNPLLAKRLKLILLTFLSRNKNI